MDGVINDVPVPNEDPPLAVAYQFNTPKLAMAPSVTVPVSQRAANVVPETIGVVLTVASTDVLEALIQPRFVAST